MKLKVLTLAYARVSRKEQNLDRQLTSIREFRPDIEEINIFPDKHTGKEFSRDKYDALKAMIKHYRSLFSKDELTIELIIEELDRLGRNKDGIKKELQWFKDHGVIVRVLELPLTLQELKGDNAWALEMVNNVIIEVYASLAEQELKKREKRQMEGIAEAKKKGIKFGRNEKQIDTQQFCLVATKAYKKEIKHADAMRQLNMTNYLYWKHFNIMFPDYKKREVA